ncbi:toll/interleukin-1 receptor domain-containing protein [Treponema sp.]|uniref:toll/interleukin-1 receptor domain-containing protein n=1 Tax=Treponema sp. TaxID=166 RepID=UPI00298E254B|nr:toll/interleukin-1 receptor domain-containing protein [Treponema sp.]MCQ2240243.1 toll/interleukin-1 receptor domain-containing protein [Treponema sp.]
MEKEEEIEKNIDFFLSHASENKEIVRKVYNGLKTDYKCWFDEAEIFPGDDIIDQVFRNGLLQSKYVILFLSKAFLNKDWPKEELKNAISRQINKKDQRVIPYLLDISINELVSYFPFFNGKRCETIDVNDIEKTIKQIKNLIRRDQRLLNKENSIGNEESNNNASIKKDSDLFDFTKIIATPAIQEVTKICERFKVYYFRAPKDLIIEINQYNENSYYGFSNYAFWGPDQATPYRSMHTQSSVQDALNDALKGLESFDSADYPDELVFFVSDNDVIFDGTGTQITMQEAMKRRSENHKKYEHKAWSYTTMNGGPWWLISKNFTTKQFSIIGPIDDDTEYCRKCSKIQQMNIDFRIETVPIHNDSKENLQKYFETEYGLTLIDNDFLYSVLKD